MPPAPPPIEQEYYQTAPVEKKAIEKPVEVVERKPQQVLENEDWNDIFPKLSLKGMAAELARHCLLESQQNGIVNLSLHPSGEQMHMPTTEEELRDALEKYFAKSIRLIITLRQQFDHSNQIETPSQKAQREGDERQQVAEQEIYNDPFVKMLQKSFDAQVIKDSIKPIGKK